jgi:hypothetical protein
MTTQPTDPIDQTPPWILQARARLAADPVTFAIRQPAGFALTLPGVEPGLLDAITVILGEDIPAHAPLEIRDDGRLYAATREAEAPAEETEASLAADIADRIDRALARAAEHQRPALVDAVTLIKARDHLRATAARQEQPEADFTTVALTELAEAISDVGAPDRRRVRVENLADLLEDTFDHTGGNRDDWAQIAATAVDFLDGGEQS